jgi:ribose 5-phosphate isomerase A
LEDLDVEPTLRSDGDKLFITDNGNLVVDCAFAPDRDPHALAVALMSIPGILEHGLFLGIADLAYIADGAEVREMSRSRPFGGTHA